MITRNADAADYLRARRAQADQARRQAEHHRRLAQVWDEQAGMFEAEAARMTAPHPLTAPDQIKES